MERWASEEGMQILFRLRTYRIENDTVDGKDASGEELEL